MNKELEKAFQLIDATTEIVCNEVVKERKEREARIEQLLKQGQ